MGVTGYVRRVRPARSCDAHAMDRSETNRQAAHIFLDAISAFDDLNNPDPDQAMALAFRHFEDVGAVTLTYDDETDVRTLDIRPILNAATVLLSAAISGYISARKIDGLQAIEMLRTAVDTTYGEPD